MKDQLLLGEVLAYIFTALGSTLHLPAAWYKSYLTPEQLALFQAYYREQILALVQQLSYPTPTPSHQKTTDALRKRILQLSPEPLVNA